MAYIAVNSFKQGLDARRSKLAAQQGSLVIGTNVNVNRGGEIERRKAFVSTYALPEGQTFGLHATPLGLYVFGSDAAPAVPSGVRYQRLQAPGDPAMVELVSADTYYATPYVVARYEDGTTHHFYNGQRVTDWDVIAPTLADLPTLAQKLAALVDTDGAVSASWATVGPDEVITITAKEANVVIPIVPSVVNAAGGVTNTVSVEYTTPPGVGVEEEVEVTLSGGYDADDVWQITVGGNEYRLAGSAAGTGSTARIFHGKVYATVQGLLYFSDAQNPLRWTTTYVPDPDNAPDDKVDTFAGFESVAAQTSNAENLVTVAPYQNRLAVFSRRSTQIWVVVPGDPADNVPVQILDNVGTMAPRSAVNFGELDVFFLSDSGIRSLRARDASNAAAVYDVGTSIDPIVRTILDGLTDTEKQNACAVVEPTEGRYMLSIGDTVFVHSYYPASEISAWTTYDLGFTVDAWAVREDRLYCRSGDTIYLYGGESGVDYDASESLVEPAWLDADKPAHGKSFRGIDVACEGTWQIEFNTNPNDNGAFTLAGHVSGQNFSFRSFRLAGKGTHAGLRFRCNDPSPARLSSAAIHFDYQEKPK